MRNKKFFYPSITLIFLLSFHAFFLVSTWAEESDEVFDERVLHEIRLTMDPGDWQTLREHYLENTWYPATFQWRDEIVETVGIRSRGQTTRDPNKPGISIRFDRYVPNQRFRGLRYLILRNLLFDTAMMRDKIAMDVFAAAGVESPRAVHTTFYVNNEYRGLYVMLEYNEDRAFLRSRFGEDRGPLLKYIAEDYYFEWRGSEPENYIPSLFRPELNQENLDPTTFVRLIDVINNSPDATFREDIRPYLNLDKFFTYLAAEQVMAEEDGIFADFGINNFYLYQFENTTLFTFIPWDRDASFGPWNRSIFQNWDSIVLTRRAFQFPEWRQFYAEKASEVARQWVNARWLLPRIERIYNQIREAAYEDQFKPFSNLEFERGIADLIFFLTVREPEVLRQIELWK